MTGESGNENVQGVFHGFNLPAPGQLVNLMAIAWDMGHSSGYQEVYNYAAELAPLLEG